MRPTLTALTLACTHCGHEVRLDTRTCLRSISADGRLWWDAHLAPGVVAFEAEHEGVVDEWVAV